MKQNPEVRPAFTLMKLNDALSHFHMQMPRWLFSDPQYSGLSLESKVAYTFLLNRFQLSRRNGWVNRHGEVYVIYTREDLAREMQISYRKAINCFKELALKHLLWEQRQGRGLPNRIFLAEVQPDEKAAYAYDCAPFCPAPRPAEIAVLDEEDETPDAAELAAEQSAMPDGQPDVDENAAARLAETTVLDMPNPRVLTCQNGSLRSAVTAVLDLPKPHTSKKEKRKKEKSDTERSTTVGRARERAELDHLIRRCEFDLFEPEEQTVLRDAITWLYYCGELTIGACTYPQLQVRETLWRLNWEVLDCALVKLRENEKAAMRNTLVYTAKVVYSTILERGCDTMLDPMVNRGKQRCGI